MPVYYFHIRRGETLETDEVGVDLPDHEAAKAEARRAAGEMLRDTSLRPDDVLEVENDRKEVILRFCCTDVEEVR
jgi:hypothetical protein